MQRLLRLRCLSWAVTKKLYSSDITGVHTNFTGKHLSQLDESLINFISNQHDTNIVLENLIESDSTGTVYPQLLLLFDNLFTGSSTKCVQNISALFSTIDLRQSQRQLSVREEYLAAAALALYELKPLLCAHILESYTKSRPLDILLLKISQQSFLLGGDTRAAYSCIARRYELLDTHHHLHGYLLGMAALGHVENDRYAEAEEAALQGITATREQDLTSISALLRVYHKTNRTSETIVDADKYKPKHCSCGRPTLLYYYALSQAQRGNYSGAASTLQDILNHIEKDATQNRVQAFVYVTMILWSIGIHTMNPAVAKLWLHPSYVHLWNEVAMLSNHHQLYPVVDVSRAIALANITRSKEYVARHLVDNTGRSDQVGVEQSLDNVSSSNPNKREGDLWSWFSNASKSRILRPAAQPIQLEYTSYIDCLQAEAEKSNGESTSTSALYNHIYSLRNRIIATNKILSVNLSSTRTQSIQRTSLPLSHAVHAFISQDYTDSAHWFGSDEIDYYRLGGSCAEIDVLTYGLIEAYLRCDSYMEAERLLLERVSVCPNDAQSWRRLASIFGHNQRLEQAQTAHYTAWQLGIGQGGMGGPT